MTDAEYPQLAVSRADGTFATVRFDSDAGKWIETSHGNGWWPTWRPNSAQFTVSEVERSGTPGSRAVLRLIDTLSGSAFDVPGSVSAPAALIAERLAHYPLWSHAGDRLCYVSPAGRTLAARIWSTGEASENTLLGGAPIFPAFSPDGGHIVLHHGQSLTLINTETRAERRISDTAAGFRAVAFVTDTKFVFAEPSSAGVRLSFATTDSEDLVPGTELRGGVAFAPQPGTGRLLVGLTPGDEAGVFSHILTVEPLLPGAPAEVLIKGPLMGFWWAPDGERIAVLAPSYSGDGRFQVRFHRPDGTLERAMEPTTLSQDMRTLVSFFDQYSLSHQIWSSDGRWFAVSGRLASDSLAASFARPGLDQVLLADLQSASPWRSAGYGLAGFFPR